MLDGYCKPSIIKIIVKKIQTLDGSFNFHSHSSNEMLDRLCLALLKHLIGSGMHPIICWGINLNTFGIPSPMFSVVERNFQLPGVKMKTFVPCARPLLVPCSGTRKEAM